MHFVWFVRDRLNKCVSELLRKNDLVQSIWENIHKTHKIWIKSYRKQCYLINQSRFTKIISRKTYLLQMCTFHTDHHHSSKSFTSGMELVSLDCLDRNLEKSSVLASGTNLKCVSSSSSSSDTWRDIAGETGADGGRGNRIS